MEKLNEHLTILAVCDDDDVLSGIPLILKRDGYIVLTASTGKDCRRQLKAHRPDLVILDEVLPDIDGRDLCKEIKSDIDFKHTHIILISELKTSSDEQADALEAGADAYIIRPIGNRELKARVKAITRLIKNENELIRSKNISAGIIASLQDGFTELDVNGVHLNANQAFLDMTGFSKEDLIGSGPPHPYWPPDQYKKIEA